MGMVANEAITAIKGLGSAISKFGKNHETLGAGVNVVTGLYKDGLKGGLKAISNSKGGIDPLKVYAAGATGITALRFGFGGLKGTFSDSDGNLDLPGVPFI